MTLLGSRVAGLLLGLILLPAAVHAAPPASAFGPEAAMAAPRDGYVGSLSVSPLAGAVGTEVTVSGTGFTAGESVELVWRTVEGRWKVENGAYFGREYEPVGYRIDDIEIDAQGGFEATFVAPEDFGFAHDIVVQQGDRALTQASFSVTTTMTVTPAEAPLGTPLEVEVTGIGWRDLENSWMLVYDNSFAGWISAVSTGGTARFTIPATGAEGRHVLRMVHGAFTFPYLNPEQNPVPDRVRPQATFELVAGEAVVPPAPETQRLASIRSLPEPGVLAVAPPAAGVGEPVEVRATDLEPGARYALNWDTVTGNRIAQGNWEVRSSVIAEAVADSDGVAVFGFSAPDDLGGAHEVWLEHESERRSGAFWMETTALPMEVARGPAGTPVTIHLKGVGWTETANIYNLTYDNGYLGYACGFNSQGDLTVHLTASGEPGMHYITLYPGIYKGEESRPNNFRIPQLTAATDHPGEDLPIFTFAFEVTAPD